MGKLFILVGKSASGKETLMSKILSDCPHIKRVIGYTTRPMKETEENGREYHFVTDSFFDEKKREGKLIEERVRQKSSGIWRYGTIDEGIVDLSKGSYLTKKDPLGAEMLKKYYGENNVITIFIDVDDGIRLMRALTRELSRKTQKYDDVCRRFLSDEEDFKNYKPDFTVSNDDVMKAVEDIKSIIKNNRK